MNSRSTASRMSRSRLLNSSCWYTSPQDDEWSRHQVTSDNDRVREEDENRKEKTDKGFEISFFFLKNVGECDETFIWTSQEILKTQHSVSRKLMLLTNVHINSVYECLLDLVRLLMSLQYAEVSVYLLRIMLLWPIFVDYLSWKEKRRFVTSRVLIEILWWRKIVVSSSEVTTETFCEDRRSEWW